jgi:hypothetical protein
MVAFIILSISLLLSLSLTYLSNYLSKGSNHSSDKDHVNTIAVIVWGGSKVSLEYVSLKQDVDSELGYYYLFI